MRHEFPARVKVARFKMCGGMCEGILLTGKRCGARLTVGKFRYDHTNPDAMTGLPTLENCRCLCLQCDAPKTAKDQTDIARAKRREAAHLGAGKRPSRPIAGGRDSKWKRKVSGEVVLRNG